MLLTSLTHIFTSYISWGSVLVMYVLFAVAFYKRPRFELLFPDIAVCLVTLYELILPFTSINPSSGYTYAMMGCYLWAFYFICRLCITTKKQLRQILLILSAAIFFIVLVGIVCFFQFRQRVFLACFNSLYEFRSLLAPWGNTINLWSTFLIVFMGVIIQTFLFYRHSAKVQSFLALVFGCIIWNGLSSFSRTQYVLLVLTLLVMAVSVCALKKLHTTKVLLGVFVVTIAGFCLINGSQDVLRTLSMHTTLSQQRSVEARYQTYAIVERSMANNLAYGVGNGNYTLAVNNDIYENDNIVYTNFASSGYLQLLVEKGLVGFIIWIVLFFTILVSLIKSRSAPAFWAIVTICLLLLKELTFAVFTDFPNLQCWFLLPIIGILNLYEGGRPLVVVSGNTFTYAYVAPLLLFLGFYTFFILDAIELQKCDSRIAAIESGKATPEAYLNLQLNTTPYLINRACIQWERYLVSKDIQDCQDIMACLQQAIALNPLDNMPRFNLALLYLNNDELDKASDILQSLVNQCPNNSLFRIGLAQLFYRQGELKKSAQQYSQALVLNPRVMDDSGWWQMQIAAPGFYRQICNDLRKSLPMSTTDPIQMAKNGKILWILGDTVQSRRCLEQAVELLPYLGRTWYNLGVVADALKDQDDAEAYFTKASLFISPDSLMQKYLPDRPSVSLRHNDLGESLQMLSKSYFLKFTTWYKARPYRRQIFLTKIFDVDQLLL